MKRKATAMDPPQNHNIPQCSVVVRRLTLGEIARMTISPFFIGNRCGRCKKFTYYSPKCTTCSISYHYKCAVRKKTCCDLPILLHQDSPLKTCSKCKQTVEFGPTCSACSAKFHSDCLTPYNQCCRLNLCELPLPRICGKCKTLVDFGPNCPICKTVYHLECLKEEISCCGFKLESDNNIYRYKCKRCTRNTGFGTVMCQICGGVYHNYCIGAIKNCCGKRVPLEIFFIPSFKLVSNYFKLLSGRRASQKNFEEVIANAHKLSSFVENSNQQRAKKRSTSCQTNALDSIAIVSVKSEVEDKEVDVPSSPPVLERETSCTPEPSSSSFNKNDSSMDSDETLRNLFDFLYNMVKKFPPQLQTQVKIDIFKTVTEAEMKLRCNMIDELPNNKK